jgi:hypothetical protein
MATYTRGLLSGSTHGLGIEVAATATDGTLIHTAVAGATDLDEVWLWAMNNHTAAVALTLEWGGVGSTEDLITVSIPSKSGLYLVAPGLLLQDGLHIGAFAGTTNVISIFGYVNKIVG